MKNTGERINNMLLRLFLRKWKQPDFPIIMCIHNKWYVTNYRRMVHWASKYYNPEGSEAQWYVPKLVEGNKTLHKHRLACMDTRIKGSFLHSLQKLLTIYGAEVTYYTGDKQSKNYMEKASVTYRDKTIGQIMIIPEREESKDPVWYLPQIEGAKAVP